MKQTAVEWIVEQLTPSISLQQKHIDNLKNEAKKMEKEQIIYAYEDGMLNTEMNGTFTGEIYYNENYKSE
jgi:hypothetical protein